MDSLNLEMANGLNRHVAAGGRGLRLKEVCIGSLGLADETVIQRMGKLSSPAV